MPNDKIGNPGKYLTTVIITVLILKSFFRQKWLMFWNYVFPVIILFFGCSVLAGNVADIRPLIGAAIILLTMLAGGIYGVSQGIWCFFGGPSALHYRRAAKSNSALIAYCLARFVLVYSALILEMLILLFFYKVNFSSSIGSLLLFMAVGTVFFVLLGFFAVAVVRTQRETLVLANVLFAALIVFSGAMIPLDFLPLWAYRLSLSLPSAHVMEGLQALIVQMAGIGEIAEHLLWLAAYAVILVVLVLWRFDWLVLDKGYANELG